MKLVAQGLLLAAALQIVPASSVMAEDDVTCGLPNNGRVQVTAENCRRLGGVSEPAEISAGDALYNIWRAKNRTEHDQANAAAQAYLSTFPNGAHADELRRWSAAYEKAMSDLRLRAEAPQPPQDEARASAETAEAELAAWQSIQKSRNAADVRAFIERYPDGEFASSARRRLAALESAARAASLAKREQKAAAAPAAQRPGRPAEEEPAETVSVDGQTYVKGREPKIIGTVPASALDGN